MDASRLRRSLSLRIRFISRMNLPSCAGEGRAGCGEGASGRGRGARGSVARLVLLLLLVGLDVLPPEPRVAAVAINVRHHVQPGQKEPLRAGPRSSGQSGRSVAVAAGRVRVKHRRGRAERGRERPEAWRREEGGEGAAAQLRAPSPADRRSH